jgi:photosystem II stability/assembly factor-like uncharacterized protein
MSSNRLSPVETCRDFASLLPLASYDLLAPDVSARLNAHLASCPFCSAQLAEYERADAALARVFADRQRRAPRLSREEIQQILGGRRIPLAHVRALRQADGGAIEEVQPAGTFLAGSPGPRGQKHRAFSFFAGLAAVLALMLLAVGLFSVLHKPSAVVLAQNLGLVRLNNLAMVSDSEGWAVGDDPTDADHGVILHYTGGQWEQVGAPANAGRLSGIFMLSASDGWIVGDQGMILHYDGQNWLQVQSPVKTALGCIFMLSSTDGWAAGNDILHYSNGAWSQVATSTDFIYQIQMLSATEGWAVGPGHILHYSNGKWTPTFVRSSGGGAHLKTPPNYPVAQPQPLSISMLSSSDGWAVGFSQENVLHYQQGQWQIVQSPDAAVNLQAVAMVSASEGWAMGVDPASNHGVIYHYLNGQWTAVVSPTTQGMARIVMLSPDEGWAAGTGGTILHYAHGTWSVAFGG